MNTRIRTTLQTMKPTPKHDKEVEKEKKKKKTEAQGKSRLNRIQSRRERKLALQQDVEKLKKKLRHEENVHRALERAFTRPLGALPRLPPYLPSHTLELLAEVAVLEEEVVRLEELVVNFRQGLYQEAVYISSSSKNKENQSDSCLPSSQNFKPPSMKWPSDVDPNEPSSKRFANGTRPPKKTNVEDHRGKENQLNTNTTAKNSKQSPAKKVPRTTRTAAAVVPDIKSFRSSSDEVLALEEASGPNKLSEDILRCLLSIFSRMCSPKNSTAELETSLASLASVSGSCEGDPYGICSEFGRRDIGHYKHFVSVEPNSIDPKLTAASSFLSRRLKLLLRKLAIVDLSGLTHQQKLAFWINIYNSCMMNAFLENGIPATPEMFFALMPKAMVNVGGHSLSAMTIEHCFLRRLPHHSRNTFGKGLKNDLMAETPGHFGLDWPEPLVTFALSYGSWSSPAVRVFTASQVEKQLEAAKRDYLQASIGISTTMTNNRTAIPELLDWYQLDFAKDVESLMDWICLQLPSELRNDAVRCVETGTRGAVVQQQQQQQQCKCVVRCDPNGAWMRCGCMCGASAELVRHGTVRLRLSEAFGPDGAFRHAAFELVWYLRAEM